MEKEQALKELEPLLGEHFSLEGIHEVNWKVDGHPGHPFTVGPEHVAHASERHGGLLGEDTLNAIGCAHQSSAYTGKCRRPFSAHQHDTVLFLKLKQSIFNSTANRILRNPAVINILGQTKIDGFCFVETPEKFRVLKDEVVS